MKRIMLILLGFVALKSTAQDSSTNEVQLSNNQLNINLLAPSISYEKKISDRSSITIAAGSSFTHYTKSDISGVSTSRLFVHPQVQSSYRNYFKRKRVRKNNLLNNSGNYFGYFAGYQFKAVGSDDFAPRLERDQFSFGVVWGMQRNYKSGIHFGFSIGPGLIGGKNVKTEFKAIGEIELGFTLFSR